MHKLKYPLEITNSVDTFKQVQNESDGWSLVSQICLVAKPGWWSYSCHFSLKCNLVFRFFFGFHLPSEAIARLCQQMKKKQKKTPGLLSLPLTQFLTDVFQLHSKSITETFPEIMIKTLASCHFDLIGDILASLFSLLSVIKAPHIWMICLCSNSWHHLLPKSQPVQVMRTLGLYLASQQHLHLCCSSLYQSYLLLMRHPVQPFLSGLCHDTFQCFCSQVSQSKMMKHRSCDLYTVWD